MATLSPKPPDLGIPTNQNFESTQLETALALGQTVHISGSAAIVRKY
jgi:hypothetical protein